MLQNFAKTDAHLSVHVVKCQTWLQTSANELQAIHKHARVTFIAFNIMKQGFFPLFASCCQSSTKNHLDPPKREGFWVPLHGVDEFRWIYNVGFAEGHCKTEYGQLGFRAILSESVC